MNITVGDSDIEKSAISLILRLFPDISPDAGFDGKSIQKAPVLLHGYVTSLVRGVRPLESSIAQTKRKQAETYALEEQPLNSVLLHAAEQEQCSFFQGIQTIGQANKCGQPINSSPEIRSGTGQNHAPDSAGFPKHAESLRGSWTKSSHWLHFQHKPGTVPAGSWLPLKKERQDCLSEQKVMLPAASVHKI